ncbi:L-histidine N(alpha)-methyltransferase [Rhodococcus sp. HNM0569]|uniref:L-histidine N(alpha)-methyltransferase n=1 Tax=Rhodococcus sp. HNM0569 TaxID=2716340 RepID=UPI00146C37E1|nr:L-histidine N(alpha)-methyltransferase [Rhodococcus sp. HNM0569]NLU82714.1 L-histidine N(alpha)-methyltransferase [Rhodococcus sp. HNM0569]
MSATTLEVHLSPEQLVDDMRTEVRAGLTTDPKWLSPKWFYDDLGSALFEEITALPEYYPTRTERALLTAHAADIARRAGAEVLVELGSGSSEKTRLLLDAGLEAGTLHTYVPQDVSIGALEAAADAVARQYPALEVRGVVSDFTGSLEHLPRGGRRMIAFLGGTLGNLVPDERADFLARIAAVLESGEHLLLGVGLVVDESVVVPAYDDAAGVTARFNRNVLDVLNHRLGADFDSSRFRHVALWDPHNEWIEMRLEATDDMLVHIGDLDIDVPFHAGEQIRTEISAKFTAAGLAAELDRAGFDVEQTYTDEGRLFALMLAVRR